MRSSLNYSNKLFTRFKHGMSPKDIYNTHEFKASLDELEFDGYYMTRTKDATQAIQLAGNDVTNLINQTLANHGYQPLIGELTSTNRFTDVSYDRAFIKLVPELKQYDNQYRAWYNQQMSLINSPETKALKKFLEHDEEYKSMHALSSTDLGALAGYDRDEGFKKMVGGDNLGLGYPSYAAAPTLLATVGTHRFENYLNKALSFKSTQLSRLNEGLPIAFTLTNADYSDGAVISTFSAAAIDKSGIKLVKLSGKFKMQVGGQRMVKVTKAEPVENSVLNNLIATLRSYKPVFKTRVVDIPTNFGPFENYHKLIEAVSHAIVFDEPINDPQLQNISTTFKRRILNIFDQANKQVGKEVINLKTDRDEITNMLENTDSYYYGPINPWISSDQIAEFVSKHFQLDDDETNKLARTYKSQISTPLHKINDDCRAALQNYIEQSSRKAVIDTCDIGDRYNLGVTAVSLHA